MQQLNPCKTGHVSAPLVLSVLIFGSIIAGPIQYGAKQAQTSTPQSFEVASVRLNTNPMEGGGGASSLRAALNHGRLTLTRISARTLISVAYNVPSLSIKEGPDWLDNDRFDILAKAENENASTEDVRLMLRALLVQRFNLAVHHEAKEGTVYALVMTGKSANLKTADAAEQTRVLQAPTAVTFQNVTMANLITYLTANLDVPIEDKTGIVGSYDFTLPRPPSTPVEPGTAPDPGELFSRISSALETQLGLKLQRAKGSIDTLIIDKIAHPSA